MKIIALMPCRNEDWVLGLSARAVLLWADALVILNHASTDATRDICHTLACDFGERIVYLEEESPVWEEMRHRQRMLDAARAHGASHISLIDADEILTGNLLDTAAATSGWWKPDGGFESVCPRVRTMFSSLPRGRVLQLPWLCLRGSITRVHTSGPWADGQNVSCGFMDSAELHWSSAGRGGYDFHHRHPMGRQPVPYQPVGDRSAGLMHLQFVSGRRLRAKQYCYQLTERVRWPDREPVRTVRERYSLAVYGQHGKPDNASGIDATLGDAPVAEWWAGYGALMQYFNPEAVPWQLAECERIRREHPGIEIGLDDFGLFS